MTSCDLVTYLWIASASKDWAEKETGRQRGSNDINEIIFRF